MKDKWDVQWGYEDSWDSRASRGLNESLNKMLWDLHDKISILENENAALRKELRAQDRADKLREEAVDQDFDIEFMC